MSSLTAKFASELKLTLSERHVSITNAASSLGSSRQALYNYLNGKSLPREAVLQRAMELWDLEVRVGREVFNKHSFQKHEGPTLVAKQTGLWDQLDAIKQENLQIAVKRVGKSLKVSVSIAIPA